MAYTTMVGRNELNPMQSQQVEAAGDQAYQQMLMSAILTRAQEKARENGRDYAVVEVAHNDTTEEQCNRIHRQHGFSRTSVGKHRPLGNGFALEDKTSGWSFTIPDKPDGADGKASSHKFNLLGIKTTRDPERFGKEEYIELHVESVSPPGNNGNSFDGNLQNVKQALTVMELAPKANIEIKPIEQAVQTVLGQKIAVSEYSVRILAPVLAAHLGVISQASTARNDARIAKETELLSHS